MKKIEILSQTGTFKGLQENKQECLNLKMSDFNNKNKIKKTKLPDAKVIRLLIDAECKNFLELIQYLDMLFNENPNIEFHINLEYDYFFEDAKKIMSHVKFKTKSITLWPDGELKDRSHLNLKNLNCPTIIPLQYIMWHNNIENVHPNNLFFNRTDIEVHDGSLPFTINSIFRDEASIKRWKYSDLYRLKDALSIKKQIYKTLSTDLKDLVNTPLTDDQKILVIMKYLVDNCIYTESPRISDQITILDEEHSHRADSTLQFKQGVCEGFAEVFMMLLNNPLIKIDCRCLGGYANKNNPESGHSWNVLRINENENPSRTWFYMDPTYNISKKNYYFYSFLKERHMQNRKIFDCANPEYASYNGIELGQDIMQVRLKDALERIEKRKEGHPILQIITPLEEVAEKIKKSQQRNIR